MFFLKGDWEWLFGHHGYASEHCDINFQWKKVFLIIDKRQKPNN